VSKDLFASCCYTSKAYVYIIICCRPAFLLLVEATKLWNQ